MRFCGACGTELAPAAAPRQVRKTVTIVFCDVTGSTALGERLDPEALRRTMGRYFEEIRAVVERHGGLVEKFIGDAVMAVFGIPTAHEDDAVRAVRAVAEIRERLQALGEELAVSLSFRTGVNTGEVVAGEGETLVTGDAVNVAARFEQAAAAGEILIGAETYRLVRNAVTVEAVEPLELKGKAEPVPAYRLVAVDPLAPGSARHLDVPIVGRVREQSRLLDDFEDVVSGGSCHLFTLLGPAGVGKSRLVQQFLSDVAGRAEVWSSRCLHYGDDITYWPLVEMLIQMGVEPDAVIGGSPAETQLAFRRLLEERATLQPQILLLDDLHWAEALFLDLVEHIADWSRDAPILLLCVARPELLETRQGWGGGKLNATTILLEPLSAEDSDELIARLAAGADLSEDARDRIAAAAARQSALHRGDARDGERERRGRRARHAADHPGAPASAARPTLRRGARGRRLRRRRGTGVPRHRGGDAGGRSDAGRNPGQPAVARSQGADPAGALDAPAGRGIPLPSSPDPRRRVRRPAQGDAGGAARAVRELARGSR